MYISSPYWTCRISRLDRVFRNTTLPLSPLSLCELSSLNHPSLIPPFSSPCDFEAFYQATVPTCARLRLPLSPFFSYRLSPLKISPRGLAPFGRTSWTARAFTTRASHQDYQLDFHLNLLPSFSLGLYCSSAELTYASTRTFALTPDAEPGSTFAQEQVRDNLSTFARHRDGRMRGSSFVGKSRSAGPDSAS